MSHKRTVHSQALCTDLPSLPLPEKISKKTEKWSTIFVIKAGPKRACSRTLRPRLLFVARFLPGFRTVVLAGSLSRNFGHSSLIAIFPGFEWPAGCDTVSSHRGKLLHDEVDIGGGAPGSEVPKDSTLLPWSCSLCPVSRWKLSCPSFAGPTWATCWGLAPKTFDDPGPTPKLRPTAVSSTARLVPSDAAGKSNGHSLSRLLSLASQCLSPSNGKLPLASSRGSSSRGAQVLSLALPPEPLSSPPNTLPRRGAASCSLVGTTFATPSLIAMPLVKQLGSSATESWRL